MIPYPFGGGIDLNIF